MDGLNTEPVEVKPWVGSHYGRRDLLPHRTLLLGESNFTQQGNFHDELVIQCVQDAIEGTDPGGFGRFSTKIIRIIFGAQTKLDAQTFWHEVAFFNFVAERVGGQPRQRPTPQMWAGSVERCLRVLDELQPERMLVLGQANWRNLLQHVPHTPRGAHQVDLHTPQGRIVRAGYVNHPSSSLRYDVWGPVARELLQPRGAVVAQGLA